MSNTEALMLQLKNTNLAIAATNKQLEAHRLLHDSAALLDNGPVCDKERELIHALMDLSLDETAQVQRLVRLITLSTGDSK